VPDRGSVGNVDAGTKADRYGLAMVEIGLLLFPKLTQLDLTGPFEVLTRLPDARVHLVWQDTQSVVSDRGMTLSPTVSFDDCPQLDVIVVPGGFGVQAQLMDDTTLRFLRDQATGARWVAAVCTGSLILGAAGLLRGYRATTHWAYVDLLDAFGALPTSGRVVIDRNRITGGGVTAGIDAALVMAAQLFGEDVAKDIQLQIEYAPDPPFQSGHPTTAEKATLTRVRQSLAPLLEERRRVVQEAAAKLDLP
jgi:cyclohexyl-isocyanide hydratase